MQTHGAIARAGRSLNTVSGMLLKQPECKTVAWQMTGKISGDLRGGFTNRQVNRRKALAAAVGCGVALSEVARSAVAASSVRILESPEQVHSASEYLIVGSGVSGSRLGARPRLGGTRVI